jgi:hypothetical protein
MFNASSLISDRWRFALSFAFPIHRKFNSITQCAAFIEKSELTTSGSLPSSSREP